MLIKIGFDPVFFRVGQLALGWHGFFVALAVAVAVWLGLRGGKKLDLPSGPLQEVAIWALVGGVVGARLFHVLDHLSYYSSHPAEALAFWEGGIAVYGAFIGGIAGGMVTAFRNRLPVWPLLDVGAVAMLVGQAIGRLGCLYIGDAWGRPTGGHWGVVYTNPNAQLPSQLIGVPTHPYPLYEIAAVLCLLGVLWLMHRRMQAPGTLFLVVALWYAATRFGLTFFRQEAIVVWGLQEAQVVALGTGFTALALLLVRLWLGHGIGPKQQYDPIRTGPLQTK